MVKRRSVKKHSFISENHVEDASSEPKAAKLQKLDESNNLEVEKILEMKNKKGIRQFKVKFAGQDISDAIWKDEDELECQDLIDEYLKNSISEEDDTEENSQITDTPKKEPRASRNRKSDNNTEYIPESIHGVKKVKGKRQFLVRWKGAPKKNDTWESENNLTCQDLIDEYVESKEKTTSKNSTPNKEEYEVDKIIDVKTMKRGRREFLIRWKGYTEKDDSWEPEKHLNCDTLMKSFLDKQKSAPAKTNKRGAASQKASPKKKIRGRR